MQSFFNQINLLPRKMDQKKETEKISLVHNATLNKTRKDETVI